MKLSQENLGNTCVFHLKGDLTIDHIDQFQSAVDERLGKQARDFVIEMAEVEVVDSKALEALLKLQEACGERLGQIRLVGVSSNVEQILKITRLGTQFERVSTVDEAIRSLRI